MPPKFGIKDVVEVTLIDLTNNCKPIKCLGTLTIGSYGEEIIHVTGGQGEKTIGKAYL